MSNQGGRSTWKWFVAYFVVREWRYNVHRKQNDQAREERLHPKPFVYIEPYSTYIGVGILAAIVSVFWFWLTWGYGWLMYFGVLSVIFTYTCVICGCVQTYRRTHE